MDRGLCLPSSSPAAGSPGSKPCKHPDRRPPPPRRGIRAAIPESAARRVFRRHVRTCRRNRPRPDPKPSSGNGPPRKMRKQKKSARRSDTLFWVMKYRTPYASFSAGASAASAFLAAGFLAAAFLAGAAVSPAASTAAPSAAGASAFLARLRRVLGFSAAFTSFV